MPRTTHAVSRPSFVVDWNGVVRDTGRQIDWANVGAGYIDATTGKKVLPAGTVVGDLLGAGKISPRVVTTNPAMGILLETAVEDDPAAALSGYGVMVGGPVYEALLPDASGSPRVLAAAIRTELDAAVTSTGFGFHVWEDVR